MDNSPWVGHWCFFFVRCAIYCKRNLREIRNNWWIDFPKATQSLVVRGFCEALSMFFSLTHQIQHFLNVQIVRCLGSMKPPSLINHVSSLEFISLCIESLLTQQYSTFYKTLMYYLYMNKSPRLCSGIQIKTPVIGEILF